MALVCALAPGAAAAAPTADGVPDIHAHRGGTLLTLNGKQRPILPEETLLTFRTAAKLGFTLELDVKLTADDVPVTIHDATLDRTTNCEGNVMDITARKLRKRCEVDLLGTEGNDKPMKKKDKRRAAVPTLAKVLKLAKKKRVPVNLEIKNIPTDPDFDSGEMPEYAKKVAAVIKASKFPAKKLIVQSFWPNNLDVIEADPYFAKTKTSFLSLSATNDAIRDAAAANGYDYISPQWPVSKQFVDDSHAMGLKVAAFTLDTISDLKAAAKAGVDAVITNDPLLARKTFCGSKGC